MQFLIKIRGVTSMARKGEFYLYDNTTIEIDGKKFHLETIEKEKIASIRNAKDAVLIVKEGGLFYYTDIPNDTCLNRGEGVNHLCKDCKKCYSLPQEQGGCKKVFDVKYDKKLEKYDFINKGVEKITSDGTNCYLVVLECKNYVYEPNRCAKSRKVQEEAMLAFFQVLFPDVKTLRDAEKCIGEGRKIALL